MNQNKYAIRGGMEGRKRLKVLSQVLRPTTLSLFEKANVRLGMVCLDAGCGGGDVSFDLAGLTGASGRVVGIDTDPAILELAIREGNNRGLTNIRFVQADVRESHLENQFDVVYARFLLTHLPDPERALLSMRKLLRPGGLMIVEEIDFAGHFCYPESESFRLYLTWYESVVKSRGGDPSIGQRVSSLLMNSGFKNVEMNVIQPSPLDEKVKSINPITMENIAEAVLAEGLAEKEEISRVIDELYARSNDPRTVMSMARVIQAWGTL